MTLQQMVAPAAVALLLAAGVPFAEAQSQGRGRGGGGGQASAGRVSQRFPGPARESRAPGRPAVNQAPPSQGGSRSYGSGYAVPREQARRESSRPQGYTARSYEAGPPHEGGPAPSAPARGSYGAYGNRGPGAPGVVPQPRGSGPAPGRTVGPNTYNGYGSRDYGAAGRAPGGSSSRYYTGSHAVPRPPAYYGSRGGYYGRGAYYGHNGRYGYYYYGPPRYYPGRPYYYGVPYRPYYYYSTPWYAFRPYFSIGFGIWAGYPVSFPVYGYQPYYGYRYPGYVGVVPGQGYYGAISFDLSPVDAEIYVDGAYVGVVGNFSPNYPPLTLAPGRHQIEIQAQGFVPLVFQVDVVPGQVIPYRGALQPY